MRVIFQFIEIHLSVGEQSRMGPDQLRMGPNQNKRWGQTKCAPTPSMIRRPVLERPDGRLLVGFKADEYKANL
jgi:hypothetical protein